MEEHTFISTLMKFKAVLVSSFPGRYDHLSPKDACNVIPNGIYVSRPCDFYK